MEDVGPMGHKVTIGIILFDFVNFRKTHRSTQGLAKGIVTKYDQAWEQPRYSLALRLFGYFGVLVIDIYSEVMRTIGFLNSL